MKTAQLLLTEAEATKVMRLSGRTLRAARQSGLLRYVLIGRAVRYTVEDLESFIDTLRKVQPACPAARSSATRSSRSKRPGAEIVPFTARTRAG